MIKFLYMYYYTFFSMHHKYNLNGTVKDPAWYIALLQVCIGLGGLFFFLFKIWKEVMHKSFWFGQSHSYIVGLTLSATLASMVYYLLFKVYGVSKETGLTERYHFIVTQSVKIFFWIFWLTSIFGTFAISFLA